MYNYETHRTVLPKIWVWQPPMHIPGVTPDFVQGQQPPTQIPGQQLKLYLLAGKYAEQPDSFQNADFFRYTFMSITEGTHMPEQVSMSHCCFPPLFWMMMMLLRNRGQSSCWWHWGQIMVLGQHKVLINYKREPAAKQTLCCGRNTVS